MLSDSDIKTAITQKRIVLRYRWVPVHASGKDDEWVEVEADCAPSEDPRAEACFAQSLTRSRLELRLGALIKPIGTSGRVRRKHRFAGLPSIADLRRCSHGWSLAPGESVVGFSNEYIELPSDVEGIVLSRVATYIDGLVVTGSYVDSTWQGLIKLHITNLGGRAVTLTKGMEVARLFFFETNNATQDSHPVTRDGTHYGRTWPQILGDKVDPFPQRTVTRTPFKAAWFKNLNELVKDYSGVTLLALGIAVSTFVGRYYLTATDANRLAATVERLDDTVRTLNERRPVVGGVSIDVPAQQQSGTMSVDLPQDLVLRATSYVDARIVGPLDGTATAKIVYGTPNQLKISVTLPKASAAQSIDVQYVLLP